MKIRLNKPEADVGMVVVVLLADPPVIRLAADPLAQVDREGRAEAARMDAILPHQFMAHMTARRSGRYGVSVMSV